MIKGMDKDHLFKFDLGVECKSIVSGFKGTITSRAQHLNGCDRYWVQPKVGKDMKMPDGMWFDEGEMEIIPAKKSFAKLARKNNDRGGFPSMIK